MTRNRPIYVVFISTVLLLFVITIAPTFFADSPLHAQGVPAAETPVTPTGIPTQPTETPTSTPTNTPEPTDTPTQRPPQTVTPPVTPIPPAPIPEPITVILFGTGLAALSAYAARRKKQD